jgi:hypothetical protein
MAFTSILKVPADKLNWFLFVESTRLLCLSRQMIDNELEFDRLAEGGEKTFLSAKKKRMMVSFF